MKKAGGILANLVLAVSDLLLVGVLLALPFLA